ncbi:MAG: hypothetical protein UY92_C0006G0002 [Candidatus Magasanikbacteria bacterium GW2011_GWA2_56_11]|uniref:Transposase n=1 Tax=Candidatus Magasanikbacteria bacterium GW2011_GWA2_56_11 TaxID=1619044 RepID=A0A0G1YGS1_9BACT|nr:MAG: hypothetical protein UY92_C0006G0002 [Candidatus Magasanikbacteria bacterium GW2011_GWA2_56_11]
MAWYHEEPLPQDEVAGTTYLVMECGLGGQDGLPAWKQAVLDKASLMVSVALAATMQALCRAFTIVVRSQDTGETMEVSWPWQAPAGSWVVDSAVLTFPVGEKQARQAKDLLSQETKPYGYRNAYRIVSLNGCTLTVEIARLMWRATREGADGKKESVMRRTETELTAATGDWNARDTKVQRQFSPIDAKTGLQALINSYLQPPELMALPSTLRPGVCQEAAQQVMSCVGLVNSPRVREPVTFPTVANRDPAVHRAAWEAAVSDMVSDLRPLARRPKREVFPGEYAADDPAGDRLVIVDPRWSAVMASRPPKPMPIRFVSADAVRVVWGHADFPIDVSKPDRHRGTLRESLQVRADRLRPQGMGDESTPRSERQRRRHNRRVNALAAKSATRALAFYARLPLLDAPELLAIADGRQGSAGSRGRGLDFNLMPMALHDAGTSAKERKGDMPVLLRFSREQLAVFFRDDIRIAWSNLVRKNGEWRLQLTLEVSYPKRTEFRRVLGVTFGLNHIATWILMDNSGAVLETGAFSPNEQLRAFLQEKGTMERDQKDGRWVGDHGFARRLEGVAHRVANQLVELALTHKAVLAIHDIDWVDKRGGESPENLVFSAWNYGQLRRYLEYKGKVAGLGPPFFAHDFAVKYACHACGACRKAGQKPENATTWVHWPDRTFHCTKCGAETALTGQLMAERAARLSLPYHQKLWAKEAGR